MCVNLLCAHTTFSTIECLAEAEILAAEMLHVVFFKSSADHLRCVVLAGQLGRKRMGGGVSKCDQAECCVLTINTLTCNKQQNGFNDSEDICNK